MSIGYACLTLGVENTNLKSCILKNATPERLIEIVDHNLNSLENIIDYNIKNNIKLFRISSDIVPFASIPNNTFNWGEIFSDKLKSIGDKAKQNNVRLSMHPGQYTVLNSPNSDVVKRAIADLKYHCDFLDSLGLDSTSKMVLHIGGEYGNKKESIDRFVCNFDYLSTSIKDRLIIENDDKIYNVAEVLEISSKIDIPVVFDNLHHQINSCCEEKPMNYWINECKKTWKQKDGRQKIHYSQQEPLKKIGSHSSTIRINEFTDFYNNLESNDIDIMLEVKDKNLSAIKCINSTSNKKIKFLEDEWSKYKYNVLEKSPQNYQKARELLKDKNKYPYIDFYNIIEKSLIEENEIFKTINGVQHVWGYFKNTANEKEKVNFKATLKKYEQGKTSLKTVKNLLKKLAIKYNQQYLLNSYYFIDI